MRKLSTEELNRLSIEEYKEAEKLPLVVVLDNIRSLNNIGSIFRTSDAFRVASIYLCGITATPPHKDIQKTALGATESVSWKYYQTTTEAIADLKDNGFEVYAIEQVEHSQMLDEFNINPNQKYAVIFGNEVDGVEQDVITQCNGSIEIPQHGIKHSINVSICSGIVIWDFYKKLRNF